LVSRHRTTPTEEQLLLDKVARLYYVKDLTQAEVAKQLGLSRSNVQRMLKEARSQGMVEIRIHSPLKTVPRIQRELVSRLGLRDCLVLAKSSQEPPMLEAEEVVNRVADLAAQYLRESLSEGSTVGLGWGRSVYRVAHSRFLSQEQDVSVVQAMGSIGGSITEFDGVATTAQVASALDAGAYYLHSPMLVADSAVRSGLLRDPHISKTLEMAGKSDIVVSSVGTPTLDHGQYLAGYLGETDLEHIRDQGAVGDICGVYFSTDGSRVDLEMNERSIAIEYDDLLGVESRIGVGSGPAKPVANIGAARSGLINVLVTDEETADGMLEYLDDEV
jgi:DNA-binding transcriptional regulator LsrR (DeoR family)